MMRRSKFYPFKFDFTYRKQIASFLTMVCIYTIAVYKRIRPGYGANNAGNTYQEYTYGGYKTKDVTNSNNCLPRTEGLSSFYSPESSPIHIIQYSFYPHITSFDRCYIDKKTLYLIF